MTVDELLRTIDRPDLWADRTAAHAAADHYMRRAWDPDVMAAGEDVVDILWIARTAELDEMAPDRRRR